MRDIYSLECNTKLNDMDPMGLAGPLVKKNNADANVKSEPEPH